MKKRARFALLATVLALSVLACQLAGVPVIGGLAQIQGSGNVIEEDLEVGEFSGVELATLGELFIELGDEEALRIEAEGNLMEYFRAEVRDEILRIDTRPNVNLRPTRPVYFYLTVVELDTIVISSSGSVNAPDLEARHFAVSIRSSGDLDMGDLDVDTLTVKVSSSGNTEMGEVYAESVSVDISSSGDVEIREMYADTLEVDMSSSGNLDIGGGEVEQQDIRISSSGDYTAIDLTSSSAEARLTSSGSATIRVRDYLEATLSSSGDLRYVGRPAVEKTVTSSGDVIQIGD